MAIPMKLTIRFVAFSSGVSFFSSFASKPVPSFFAGGSLNLNPSIDLAVSAAAASLLAANSAGDIGVFTPTPGGPNPPGGTGGVGTLGFGGPLSAADGGGGGGGGGALGLLLTGGGGGAGGGGCGLLLTGGGGGGAGGMNPPDIFN